jgi:predicted amidohydrolase
LLITQYSIHLMSLKDQLLNLGVRKLLDYKAQPARIERALRKTSPRASTPTNDRVTVAAIQMEFNLLDDGAQYAEKIYALCRQAVMRGAQLVALPEYAWTPLIGMLPGIRELAAQATGGLEGAASQVGGGASLADILRTVAPAVESAFVATGRGVAQALDIYLMSGSTISRDTAGHLYNVGYLFGPDGVLIGKQFKLHAFTEERDWLTVGDSLQVFALSFARVALPICMDFTYWETTRLAWLDGAEIFINPSADASGDEEFPAARGVRTRVQESPAYGILSNIVTDLFGLHWRGPSRIVAPVGLDSRGSVIAQADTADREEVLVAELDLARLRAFRTAHAPEFNRALYKKYLPRAYEEYRTRVAREGRRIVR